MSTRTGIEHEETLLYESAARESSLNTQVLNMEIDLKNARAEVRRLQTEKERLEQVLYLLQMHTYLEYYRRYFLKFSIMAKSSNLKNIILLGLFRPGGNERCYPFRNKRNEDGHKRIQDEGNPNVIRLL